MKILMLTWEYPPRIVGGIARVVYDLSHRLIKDGHDVTVITYREGDAPYYEDDKGVKVHRIDNYMINPNNFIDWIMQMNFNMIAKANQLIAEEGSFDVIHAHDWLVTYAAKTIKNSYNIPIVATIHATEAGRNSGIHDETQKYINDTEWMLTYEATEVIVNSNYMKGEVQRLFVLPFEKINVVANGVNLNKFTGKGGMLDELKAEAEALGLGNKVYFAGYLGGKDVEKMYKAADVLVFPSTYEPFGIVALEGMLSERPIVVSDAGGLAEIVQHRETGMKSYCGNPNSIADSILELLYNPELYANIVKKAKQKVKNDYNWTKIAQDTHFTYQKAICETMAERQRKQIEQENAQKAKKAKGTEKEITNILSFKKRQAYA